MSIARWNTRGTVVMTGDALAGTRRLKRLWQFVVRPCQARRLQPDHPLPGRLAVKRPCSGSVVASRVVKRERTAFTVSSEGSAVRRGGLGG